MSELWKMLHFDFENVWILNVVDRAMSELWKMLHFDFSQIQIV